MLNRFDVFILKRILLNVNVCGKDLQRRRAKRDIEKIE